MLFFDCGKVAPLPIISSVRYSRNARLPEYLGRKSIHAQIQDLLMEVCLSMHKMEQIQKASVIFVTVSCTPHTGVDSREKKMTVNFLNK